MKRSDEQGPRAEHPAEGDLNDAALPCSLAWIRQITLWQIVKNPGLVKWHPRIFLEKPWLPILLFAFVGFALGIISGVKQGMAGGIRDGIEAAAGGSFVGGVMGAIVVSPVSFVLWMIRMLVERSSRHRPFDPSRKIVHVGGDCVNFEHHRFPLRPNRIVSIFMLFLVVGGEAVFCCMAVLEHSAWFFALAVVGVIAPVGMATSVFRAFLARNALC